MIIPNIFNTTESLILPNNPSTLYNGDRGYNNYIFDFNIIKHNIETPLCMEWVNLLDNGGLAFDSFLVNEYDFSNIKYENFFSCKNCNLNIPTKFSTTNNKCAGKNYIILIISNKEDLLFA